MGCLDTTKHNPDVFDSLFSACFLNNNKRFSEDDVFLWDKLTGP